jgi:NAD(P)H-dependent FMN reductase
MLNLKIIIASTRPGRKGPVVASWIISKAAEIKEFQLEVLDLAAINLPMMDEPAHPRFKTYQYQHTKDWSAKIESADAFIMVTPEYNYSLPAPLKNAIDYLSLEWGYKPVAFVSYGGLAGGTRAVQMLKQVVTSLKMMPVVESVNIPFFIKYIDDNGKFNADETLEKSADAMLKELLLWAKGLKAMRESK